MPFDGSLLSYSLPSIIVPSMLLSMAVSPWAKGHALPSRMHHALMTSSFQRTCVSAAFTSSILPQSLLNHHSCKPSLLSARSTIRSTFQFSPRCKTQIHTPGVFLVLSQLSQHVGAGKSWCRRQGAALGARGGQADGERVFSSRSGKQRSEGAGNSKGLNKPAKEERLSRGQRKKHYGKHSVIDGRKRPLLSKGRAAAAAAAGDRGRSGGGAQGRE
mmetsp:Transcript_14663/g.29377  ORF Transcript_14663/g.29377 Transcript_14663/m.29377 type:complete len:216 (-) Transcript_14663:100-747(-)